MKLIYIGGYFLNTCCTPQKKIYLTPVNSLKILKVGAIVELL